MKNVILNSDSYKVSHFAQYPQGTTDVFSYIESRGGFKDYTVFFGLQGFIKQNLLTPITHEDIDKAQQLIDAHLGPGIFNREGWEYIVNEHNGYMPVRIRALPEGMKVPTKTALVTVENTDPNCYWVTSYLETAMLRSVWYPSTVATISNSIKQTILSYLEETSTEESFGGIGFMLHDFGARGASSEQTAGIGGLAHLINFLGTDNMSALVTAVELYGADSAVGLSVIAAEHSTACVNANAAERDDYAYAEKMVQILEQRVQETGQFQIVSAVADTYDVYRFTRDYIGESLRDRIMNSGGRFVVRPDSGDPTTVPIDIVEILCDKFGYEVANGQYKVLPGCIRVLQGDGIDEDMIKQILENAKKRGIAAENFVFGCGGSLLQAPNRDWAKFAMKASYAIIDDVEKDVYKDPVTDSGKVSKKGRISTYQTADGNIVTKRTEDALPSDQDLLETVFVDGKLVRDQSFDAVRENAK